MRKCLKKEVTQIEGVFFEILSKVGREACVLLIIIPLKIILNKYRILS